MLRPKWGLDLCLQPWLFWVLALAHSWPCCSHLEGAARDAWWLFAEVQSSTKLLIYAYPRSYNHISLGLYPNGTQKMSLYLFSTSDLCLEFDLTWIFVTLHMVLLILGIPLPTFIFPEFPSGRNMYNLSSELTIVCFSPLFGPNQILILFGL